MKIMKSRIKEIATIMAATAVIAGCALSATGAKPNRSNVESDRRKADMIYLEALNQRLGGHDDAYSQLVERAYQLNPDDKYVGSEYGTILVRTGVVSNDSARIDEGMKLLKAYAESEEGMPDYYTQAVVARMASILGDDEYALKVLKRVYEDNPDRPEAALEYADKLSDSREEWRINEALAVLDTIEQREGPSVVLTGRRFNIYMMSNDTASVLNEARRQISLMPTNADPIIMAGDVFGHFNKTDSALAYYNRAIELNPENGIAYYSLANLYMNQGDSVGYGREMMKALELPDLDIDTKTELIRDYVARLYKDQSKRPELEHMFNRMLELNPHEASVHGFYGGYLATVGQYKDAAEQIEYQLALDPGTSDSQWGMLTSLYQLSEEPDKAIDAAQRGMKYFPDNEDLPLLLGASYTQSGEPLKAVEVLKPIAEGAKDVSRKSDLLTAMGDALYAAEMPDSAFTYYEQAMQLNPNNLLAMNNCAYFLACQNKDLDRALVLIETVVESKEDDPTSLDTYAWVLFKMGDYAKAGEMIDKALAGEDTPSAELYEHAGDIYFMNRKHKEAVEYWKKALELDKDNELLKRKVTNKTYFYE